MPQQDYNMKLQNSWFGFTIVCVSAICLQVSLSQGMYLFLIILHSGGNRMEAPGVLNFHFGRGVRPEEPKMKACRMHRRQIWGLADLIFRQQWPVFSKAD